MSLRRQARGHSPDGDAFSPTFDERLALLPTRLGVNARAFPETSSLVKVLVEALRVEAKKLAWDLNKLTPSSFADQLAQAHKWWSGVAKPVNLDSPVTLMHTAYAALQAMSGRLGRPGQAHLMALALIGIAERGLHNMRRCGICFRWAIPGQPYCQLHSQSAAAVGTLHERDARRQQDARLKRRNPMLAKRHDLAPRIYSSRMPVVVGRMLWNLRTLDEQKTRVAIRREIRACAHLRTLIGPNADRADHRMVRELRAKIDPFEFDLTAWGPTLKAAHAWLDAQALTSGHRGVGIKSRAAMLQACHLAEMGMDRLEVAQAMDRTPKAISQWLKRYTDPAHPLNDLSKRLEAALAAPRPDKRRRADRLALWMTGALPKPSRHE